MSDYMNYYSMGPPLTIGTSPSSSVSQNVGSSIQSNAVTVASTPSASNDDSSKKNNDAMTYGIIAGVGVLLIASLLYLKHKGY
jgi:tRNA A22 N-methylase